MTIKIALPRGRRYFGLVLFGLSVELLTERNHTSIVKRAARALRKGREKSPRSGSRSLSKLSQGLSLSCATVEQTDKEKAHLMGKFFL